MASMIPAVPKLLLLVGFLCLAKEAVGRRSYNEMCANNANNPQDPNNCDYDAYLRCNRMLVCECQPGLEWQNKLNKCTYSLGGSCNGDNLGQWPGTGSGNGGDHGGNVKPGCPRNAECNKSNGRCSCLPGYKADQGSECNGGDQVKNIVSTTFGIALFYFIAMKMMF